MRLRDLILEVLETMNTPRRGVGSYSQQKARKTIQKIKEEHEQDNSWLFTSGPREASFEDSHENLRKQALCDQLEFDLMVLLYAMNEDDGVISKEEKDVITSHIVSYRDKITERDRKQIQKRLPKTPTLDHLVYFVQDHQLSESDVSESLNILRSINHDSQYSNALFHIAATMRSRLDYFH